MFLASDRAAVTKELAAMMKKKRSETDMKENKKQSLQEIEDRAVSIGKKCRSEVSYVAEHELLTLRCLPLRCLQFLEACVLALWHVTNYSVLSWCFVQLQFDRLHSIESNKLEEKQRAAIQELVKIQAKVSTQLCM